MSKSPSPMARLVSGLHVPRGLLVQTAWTTAGHGLTQVVRFASTIVLTRLLAPELFGIMVLLVSLRVGIELFSDLGIGSGMIASKRTRDETFYNTAWTMQFLRGVLLGLLVLALLPLLRSIYDDPGLQEVLPALSVFLIVAGMHSMGPTIAVKELETRRIAIYDTICAVAQAALTIGVVIVSPTIWGLVSGQILGSLFAAAASYLVTPGLRYRPKLDKQAFLELFSFGKWIFLSSVVFFLSSYMDRLLLGKYVAMAMLGIYGVARSLGDVFAQFGTRMANTIVFPKVASADVRGYELRGRIAKRRLQFLALVLVGLAALIALAEPLIAIMYDQRYFDAALVLPWVALATWLGILNALKDSFALGVGKPQLGTVANIAKLLGLVALLPVAIAKAGIVGAAAATVCAELARYAVLSLVLTRERLSFARQDILATALLLGLAFALNEVGRLILPAWFTLLPFAGLAVVAP